MQTETFDYGGTESRTSESVAVDWVVLQFRQPPEPRLASLDDLVFGLSVQAESSIQVSAGTLGTLLTVTPGSEVASWLMRPSSTLYLLPGPGLIGIQTGAALLMMIGATLAEVAQPVFGLQDRLAAAIVYRPFPARR